MMPLPQDSLLVWAAAFGWVAGTITCPLLALLLRKVITFVLTLCKPKASDQLTQ